MFAVFVLPALVAWLTNGAPVDRVSLSLLGAALISGVLAYIKEALGTSSPPIVQTPATVVPAATKTP